MEGRTGRKKMKKNEGIQGGYREVRTVKVWEKLLADYPCDLGVLAKDCYGNGRYGIHVGRGTRG